MIFDYVPPARPKQRRRASRRLLSLNFGWMPSVLKSSLLAALFFAAAFTAAPVARAQVAEHYTLKNEIGVWAGYSPDSPHVIGITSERQLIVLAAHYGRTLWERDAFALQWTVDVAPLEMVLQPKITGVIPPPPQTIFVEGHREYVYGFGLHPLGLRMNFLRQRRLQPFLASTAGFVASLNAVPVDVPQGTKFNFTFDFQGGVQWFNHAHDRAWTFGYRLDHISNANRASLNPGMDGHVVFLGYSFFR